MVLTELLFTLDKLFILRGFFSYFKKFVWGVVLADDPQQKKSRLHKTKSQSHEMELFNVESHSGKQLRHFKFLSVSFMSQLLASHSFVKQVRQFNISEGLI